MTTRDLVGYRVVAVHAHPDDEAITTGGSLFDLARRGADVLVVTCTLGEEGEVIGEPFAQLSNDHADQLGGFRIAELTRALGVLGVRGRFLGGAGWFRDSGMSGSPAHANPRAFVNSGDEAVDLLTRILEVERPHLLITYGPDGGYGHPDHIRAHELTVAACDRLRAAARDSGEGTGSGDAALWATMWTVTDDDALRDGLDAIAVVPDAWTRADFDDLPSVASDFAVSLSDADLAAKTASLRAHATQVWVGDGGVSMVNPRAATGAVDASGDARGVWALSNLICQPITPAEHYRLGTAGADLAAVFAGEKSWDELRRDSAAASTAPAASAGAPADTEGASR